MKSVHAIMTILNRSDHQLRPSPPLRKGGQGGFLSNIFSQIPLNPPFLKGDLAFSRVALNAEAIEATSPTNPTNPTNTINPINTTNAKILHIIDSGGFYGAEAMLLNLMEEQVALGLDPILASIGRPGVGEKAIEVEARRRNLSVRPFRMKPGPNWRGCREILEFAKSEGADLIHTHGYKGNILFSLMPRALRQVPMVTTLHGYTWTGGLTRMYFYQKLDAMCLRRSDQVVLVNGAMTNHPFLRGKRNIPFKVIENGIAVSRRGDRPAGGELRSDIIDFAGKGFTIAAIGRLSREKGFDRLVEAVAGLVAAGKDIRLVIMGDGYLKGELFLKVNELGIADRVMFSGYVDGAGRYLPYFNLFAMSSLTEGLPMVLLEAMAAEVPIVATYVGGIPEVLDHGEGGVLVGAGDVGALKGGIEEVMDRPEAAARRTACALARVREVYSSRAMAERYSKIYADLLPANTIDCEVQRRTA